MNPYAVEHQCSEDSGMTVQELEDEILRLKFQSEKMVNVGFVYGFLVAIVGIVQVAIIRKFIGL